MLIVHYESVAMLKYIFRNLVSQLQTQNSSPSSSSIQNYLGRTGRELTPRNTAKVHIAPGKTETVLSESDFNFMAAFSLVCISMALLFLLNTSKGKGFIRGLWTSCWLWYALNGALRSFTVRKYSEICNGGVPELSEMHSLN